MSESDRHPSIDPAWTFEEMINNVNNRYYPGGMISGVARNAVIEAWGAAVGGTRASTETENFIKRIGSKTAAAKAIQMSPKTFTKFRELFRTLPDPLEQIREGLLLVFSSSLLPFDRWLIDAVVLTVLGRNTKCRLVEIVDSESTFMLRFANASEEELRAVGNALWQRAWRKEHDKLQAVDGILAEVTNNDIALNRLDGIRDVLGYIELRSLPVDKKRVLGSKKDVPMRKDCLNIETWGSQTKTIEET